MKLSELVHSLPINKSKSQCLYRLMRTLIHSKLFISAKISDENEEEGYWLTPSSQILLKDNPMSMAPFVLGVSDPIMIDPLRRISEWFQSESATPFAFTHGKEFWEYVGQEPRLNNLFNEAMVSDSMLVISVVMKKCKQVFEGLISIVDVAGGKGVVGKAIVDAYPGLKCTVLDLPNVVDGLEGGENLVYASGNMFDFIPSADAILLKWILHNWSDEECVKILKKCKEAIPSDKGKLIIIDMILDDQHEAFETQLFFDMVMMNLFRGKERTEKEWAKIFSESGFTTYKITPVLELRSIIEVFP
ncbi:hypothetical protein RD792_016187 [Penstemon davidsonii]|uniref:O-methyltransferase C-terminal domain-containing protein n=1 Tax=Penstemon davidsonii TaxID=160366 RepID=A0ABR0CIK9_9LAMI|nr:hypothetical protein RD792_016187 [Penstemon davidsonii]